MSELRITSARRIAGSLRVPSDKSLTHRAYMLGSIANGVSELEMPLRGEDCEGTRRILEAMGLRTDPTAHGFRLLPSADWQSPLAPLDCGNSGTTMRLICGLIASRPISATVTGDASLSRRPMGRVADPLRRMGADIEGDQAPMAIRGADLRAIDYQTPVASAQIKSAILLAGLRADGDTIVTEPAPSRDHTERMLRAMGADVRSLMLPDGRQRVTISPNHDLSPFRIRVPADISSAAFPMVAAAMRGSVELLELSVNPSRTGILDVLNQVGSRVDVTPLPDALGEPVANVRIIADSRRPFRIGGALVPRLIDEIPALAVLATQLEGITEIRDAAEMRVKETDRIEVMAAGLRRMGARVETYPDGMAIEGPTPLTGTDIDSTGDHRIGMAFAVAGLMASGETVIRNADHIATSYPDFASHLAAITAS